MEQVSCSTFSRLKQYHEASLVRFRKTMSATDVKEGTAAQFLATRERQRALDEKRHTSDMLARHEVECPICRLERRNVA